jgi:hypothetical protein
VEIINLASKSVPLSTSYLGDNDVTFIGIPDYTEEGYNFNKETYLSNISDQKINNYSSIYLTSKYKTDEIIRINQLPDLSNIYSFNTSIIDNNTGKYLTVSSEYAPYTEELVYYFSDPNVKFIEPSERIFEITLLNSTSATITHRGKNRINYHLLYNNNVFYFSSIFSSRYGIFNYILDKTNNKMCFFGNSELITCFNDKLSATSDLSLFKINYFNVNYYIQKLKPKLNTSWVSYKNEYTNAYEINKEKSRNNLKNNFLAYNNYTNVTGNSLNVNILTLKNQKTHKNYTYNSDYIEKFNEEVPAVENRNYTGLFTGNDQEKGDYGITLNYEFYNMDYKFFADGYTQFTAPKSLYPYKQININDLNWNYKGSIAGESPYLSDKIFQKRIKTSDSTGEYLCSWLYRNRDGSTIWLDRYYYPEKTSYSLALVTNFNYTYIDPVSDLIKTKLLSSEDYDVPHIYNSLEEEAKHTPQTIEYALYGRSFFDKRSDLVIIPNSEYIYHRLGNKYVSEIITQLEKFIIKNGLVFLNGNDATIYSDNTDLETIEYVLNGDSYSLIEDYNDANLGHQFTLSFWMKSDNWQEGFGHQILGNLNDKGFGILYDRLITPLITIQSGQNVYVYNTNFELLDTATSDNEVNQTTKIKDIYRTDHLDSFYTINIE